MLIDTCVVYTCVLLSKLFGKSTFSLVLSGSLIWCCGGAFWPFFKKEFSHLDFLAHLVAILMHQCILIRSYVIHYALVLPCSYRYLVSSDTLVCLFAHFLSLFMRSQSFGFSVYAFVLQSRIL